MQAVFVVPV
uniref:Uncharacterized protein n=1 Tax=Anguilla anguilla TaxID=7936 RepID=A0A0E9TD80_ANGAN